MWAGQTWPDEGNDHDGALGAVQAGTDHRAQGPRLSPCQSLGRAPSPAKFQVVLRMLARIGMNGGSVT